MVSRFRYMVSGRTNQAVELPYGQPLLRPPMARRPISRRLVVGGIAAAPLAMPGLIRAQSTSKPVRLGLLSDMGGPYRDVGGPGNRYAAELAIADFGGSVLGRPIEVLQADDQNKPPTLSSTSIAREWIDALGVDAVADGAVSSSGLAIQQVAKYKKRPYLITGPATSDMTGKQCSSRCGNPFRVQIPMRIVARHRHGAGEESGGDSWFFITADYAFGYALERDTAAAVTASGGKDARFGLRAPLGNRRFLLLPDSGAGLRGESHWFCQRGDRPAELHQAVGGIRADPERRQDRDLADGDQRRELTGSEGL